MLFIFSIIDFLLLTIHTGGDIGGSVHGRLAAHIALGWDVHVLIGWSAYGRVR